MYMDVKFDLFTCYTNIIIYENATTICGESYLNAIICCCMILENTSKTIILRIKHKKMVLNWQT